MTPGSHAASYQTNTSKRDIALNNVSEVDTNDFFYKYPALTPSLFLMTSSLDLIGSTLAGIGLLVHTLNTHTSTKHTHKAHTHTH